MFIDAFAHTSRPPEIFFLKRDIFDRLELFKTCSDEFAHTFSKKIFLTVWSG